MFCDDVSSFPSFRRAPQGACGTIADLMFLHLWHICAGNLPKFSPFLMLTRKQWTSFKPIIKYLEVQTHRIPTGRKKFFLYTSPSLGHGVVMRTSGDFISVYPEPLDFVRDKDVFHPKIGRDLENLWEMREKGQDFYWGEHYPTQDIHSQNQDIVMPPMASWSPGRNFGVRPYGGEILNGLSLLTRALIANHKDELVHFQTRDLQLRLELDAPYRNEAGFLVMDKPKLALWANLNAFYKDRHLLCFDSTTHAVLSAGAQAFHDNFACLRLPQYGKLSHDNSWKNKKSMLVDFRFQHYDPKNFVPSAFFKALVDIDLHLHGHERIQALAAWEKWKGQS